MAEIVRERYLNYSRVLVPETLGQIMGPDTYGESWVVHEIDERTDGKVGCMVTLRPIGMGF